MLGVTWGSNVRTDVRKEAGHGDAGVTSACEPTAGMVRAALDQILASDTFSHAARPSSLLKYLVEHALEGANDKLNEHALGVALFNRGAGFDGGVDPIVRVEAGRLRRRLCTYYETEGSGDPVVIELPQRTYTPVFRRREQLRAVAIPPGVREQPSAAGLANHARSRARNPLAVLGAVLVVGLAACVAALMPRTPAAGYLPGGGTATARSIVVLPFTDSTARQEVEHFSEGLSEEITERLNRIPGLRVVSHLTAFNMKGKTADVREIGRQVNAGFVLDGSVRRSGDRLRVNVCLVDASEGYDLWSRTYDREFKEGFATEEELAEAIVADVREKFSNPLPRPAGRSGSK